MKNALYALASIVILATVNVAVAQTSWREQRARTDWRNNTWREQEYDRDWRNEGWRRDRANENWQTREELQRQRMPNNATDTGAMPPAAAETKPTGTEQNCAAIERDATGACPDNTATAITTPPAETPPKVTDRPDGQ
jgi:hypothetical protein